MSDVHHWSAGIFLVSLAIISFFFGVQEGRRPQQRPTGRAMLPPGFWRWFHLVCALLVLGGVAFVFLAKRQHMTGRPRAADRRDRRHRRVRPVLVLQGPGAQRPARRRTGPAPVRQEVANAWRSDHVARRDRGVTRG